MGFFTYELLITILTAIFFGLYLAVTGFSAYTIGLFIALMIDVFCVYTLYRMLDQKLLEKVANSPRVP